MGMFEFMAGSPFTTVCIAWVIYLTIKLVFRTINIRKHGWPPAHCDADGDVHKPRQQKEDK